MSKVQCGLLIPWICCLQCFIYLNPSCWHQIYFQASLLSPDSHWSEQLGKKLKDIPFTSDLWVYLRDLWDSKLKLNFSMNGRILPKSCKLWLFTLVVRHDLPTSQFMGAGGEVEIHSEGKPLHYRPCKRAGGRSWEQVWATGLPVAYSY